MGFTWQGTPAEEAEILPALANVEDVTYEEAVTAWNFWANEQSSYVARCLERAGKRRTRTPKATGQLSLFDPPGPTAKDRQLALF